MKARELALFLYANMEHSRNFGDLELYAVVDGQKKEVVKVVATETVFADQAGIVLELK